MVEIEGAIWWVGCRSTETGLSDNPILGAWDYTIHQQLIAQMMGWC